MILQKEEARMLQIEKRRTPAIGSTMVVSVVATVASLLICMIVLQARGIDAFGERLSAAKETYFTEAGIMNLLTYVPSISLCALAVVVAAKAGLWNVGVEGQFLAGALVAGGIGLKMPGVPWYIMVPFIFVLSTCTAGLLCYLSVLPRIYFGINEILTTVLFNSIMGYAIGYVSNIAWRDTTSTSPQTIIINENSFIGRIPGLERLHWGLIVAIIIVLIFGFTMKKSVLGFKMRAVGESNLGAEYLGINVKKIYFITMIISGCLAGAAGMFEVCGITHRLRPQIASDYGLSGFVIAWISRLNPIVVLIVSYIFAGFTVIGFKLQMAGIQSEIVSIIKGLILIFILAGNIFTYYTIKWVPKGTIVDEEQKKRTVKFSEMLTDLFFNHTNHK